MTSEPSFRGIIDKFETVTKVSDWGADLASAAEKSDKTRPGLIIHLLAKKRDEQYSFIYHESQFVESVTWLVYLLHLYDSVPPKST